ncbi:hypothetical protein K435DRAFT_869721 [Dendrothele bispora CBS 962.96]|uniref:Mid2 domain-containing protein n=1 Tax=Dendrothele bispora (strain CBS 962.96) TaxID=1314807 RepID=A0A4V4HCY7_DENBC|nr:hypothetical protein K435DRAFT_869721 [Dendrothele bispora CBS 962.96]
MSQWADYDLYVSYNSMIDLHQILKIIDQWFSTLDDDNSDIDISRELGSSSSFLVTAPAVSTATAIPATATVFDSDGDLDVRPFEFELDSSSVLCSDERDNDSRDNDPPTTTSEPERPSSTPSTSSVVSSESSTQNFSTTTSQRSFSTSTITTRPETSSLSQNSIIPTSSSSTELENSSQDPTSTVVAAPNSTTTVRNSDASPDHTHNIAGIVAGAVAGGIALILICGFGLVYIRRRRNVQRILPKPLIIPQIREFPHSRTGSESGTLISQSTKIAALSPNSEKVKGHASLQVFPGTVEEAFTQDRNTDGVSPSSSAGAVVLSDHGSQYQNEMIGAQEEQPSIEQRPKNNGGSKQDDPRVASVSQRPALGDGFPERTEEQHLEMSDPSGRSPVVQGLQAQVQQLMAENARLNAALMIPPPAYQRGGG